MCATRDATITELNLQIAALQAHGRLRVHLSHASNLRAADVNGSSDPFIVLILGGRTQRSAVVKKNLNPTYNWDFVFSFPSVDRALGETLLLEAWDSDTITDHDQIGHASVMLEQHRAQLEAGERVECTVPLEYKPFIGKPVAAGEVVIALSWEARTC